MQTDCVIVWTTIGSETDGRALAATLVGERLAACVNVLPEMDSTYRWKGAVEAERERQLVMKTTAARVPAPVGSAQLGIVYRVVNLALVSLAAIAIYQLTLLVRAGLLWRVRRKLILSYILVGAVPFLLLVAFSLLGFLLVFFDISSYLVRSRLTSLTDQANTLARTTQIEVERTPFEGRQDVLSRRQSVLETRYPGISLAMVPTSGNPRCGLAASQDLP